MGGSTHKGAGFIIPQMSLIAHRCAKYGRQAESIVRPRWRRGEEEGEKEEKRNRDISEVILVKIYELYLKTL